MIIIDRLVPNIWKKSLLLICHTCCYIMNTRGYLKSDVLCIIWWWHNYCLELSQSINYVRKNQCVICVPQYKWQREFMNSRSQLSIRTRSDTWNRWLIITCSTRLQKHGIVYRLNKELRGKKEKETGTEVEYWERNRDKMGTERGRKKQENRKMKSRESHIGK
jgi:hypothetical protein